ncbi:unnamed protein product [Prorocentrum cordatum]|nr:unnamed protein product [Polarella glacialis]
MPVAARALQLHLALLACRWRPCSAPPLPAEGAAPHRWPYTSARVTGSKTLVIIGPHLPKKGVQVILSHFPFLAWVALDEDGSMRSHNDCPHLLANTLTASGGNWSDLGIGRKISFKTYAKGNLQRGADIRDSMLATFAEASQICASDQACAGFTYQSKQKKPKQRVTVWFKSVFNHDARQAQGWHSWKFDSYGADNECRNACLHQFGDRQELDPWCVLGLDVSDSEQLTKRRYKDLVKRYHPDKHKGSEDTTAKFRDIQAAWEIIREPNKRRVAIQRKNSRRIQKHPYETTDRVTRLTRSTVVSLVFAGGSRDTWLIHMFNGYDGVHWGTSHKKGVSFIRAASELSGSMHFGAIDCYDWRPLAGQLEMTSVCGKINSDIPQRGASDLFLIVPFEGISVKYDESSGLTGEALVKFARSFIVDPYDLPVATDALEGLRADGRSPQLWLVTTSQKKSHVCESCPVATAIFKRSSIVNGFPNAGILDCSKDAITGNSTRPPALACSFGRPTLLLVSDLKDESCAYCYHEGKQPGCIYSRQHAACTTVDEKFYCRNTMGEDHVQACFQRHTVEPLMPVNWRFSLREFGMALHLLERTAVAIGNSSSSCSAE